jgi:hypothetical protein
MRPLLLAVLTIVSVATPFDAVAGIGDPPPTLGGQKSLVSVSVTGAISGAGLESVFMCTSGSTMLMTIAVQTYSRGGAVLNDVTNGNGTAPLAPGETTTIATGPVTGIHTDSLISLAGPLRNGSARVLSTDSHIICTALLVDAMNSPPTSMTTLTVVKKTTQHGN